MSLVLSPDPEAQACRRCATMDLGGAGLHAIVAGGVPGDARCPQDEALTCGPPLGTQSCGRSGPFPHARPSLPRSSDQVHTAGVRVPVGPGLPQEDGGGDQEAGAVERAVAAGSAVSLAF